MVLSLIRKVRTRAMLAAALSVVTASLSLSPAFADGGSTVSGPPPYPPPGMEVEGGWNGVCPLIQAQVDLIYWNPQIGAALDGSPTVKDVAGVKVDNGGCGESVTFHLETNVCGFFGCEWRDVDSQTYDQLPANGTLISRLLSAPLRKGTHTYRVRAEITTYKAEVEDDPAPGIIAVVPEVDEQMAPRVALTFPDPS